MLHIGADTMPCTTIVGVVTNSRRQSLIEGPIPQLYRPLRQLPASVTDGIVSFFGYALLARAERPQAVVEPLRRVIQRSAPEVPFAHVTPLREQFGRHTRSWVLGATMFSAFGAVALALAAVGLYSVVAFIATLRRHEYGVRLALGATGAHLIRITMLRGLIPAAAGLLIGMSLTLAGGRLVASMLFDTPPHDPVVLGAASVILLSAAAFACLFPGMRAAQTDPVAALRAE